MKSISKSQERTSPVFQKNEDVIWNKPHHVNYNTGGFQTMPVEAKVINIAGARITIRVKDKYGFTSMRFVHKDALTKLGK